MRRFEKGFTLVEVSLAIGVMATGILGMCSLYSLGFRESRQSVEDVAAVALADAYLAPLVQGLSATNMTWTNWRKIGKPVDGDEIMVADGVLPNDGSEMIGWAAYVERTTRTNVEGDKESIFRVRNNPNGIADSAYREVAGQLPSEFTRSSPPTLDGYNYGLVVTRKGARIQLAFRLARRESELMGHPVVVSEVHFQGDPEQ